MKTPAELIAELQHILFEIDNDDLTVRDFSRLFTVPTSHPDIAGSMDAMNRLAWVINDHARNIYSAHERMSEILKKLANP